MTSTLYLISVVCICILEVIISQVHRLFFIKFVLIIKLKRIKILLILLKERSCKINIAADIQALFFLYTLIIRLCTDAYKTKCTTLLTNNILIS